MWHSTRDSAWPGPGRLPSNGPPGTEHLLLSTLPIHRVRDTTFSIGTQVSFASVLLVRLYLCSPPPNISILLVEKILPIGLSVTVSYPDVIQLTNWQNN